MREKIAVLGAGVAGLTAALELSATEELRERYEVTVYQLGWRCGGKCATGRSAAYGSHVEEHGLHLWFGGYDNAFRLLADCYAELDRPAEHPLPTIDSAWAPLTSVVLYDRYDDGWSYLFREYPVLPGLPWDEPGEPRFWDILATIVDLTLRHGRGLRHTSSSRVGPLRRLLRRAGDAIEVVLVRAMELLAALHRRRGTTRRRHASGLAWLLSRVRARTWRRHAVGHLDDDDVRHNATYVDLMLTLAIGMLRDRVPWEGTAAINDLDFCDWLRRHDVQQVTLGSPDVRVVYDESFADTAGRFTTAVDGVPAAPPGAAFAAGPALYGMIRTLLYRGSVMWQAKAGMGDTAIAPMYETLVKRGVDVRFFQQVTNLGVDAERGVVDRVDVLQQARPKGTYQPLVDVNGLGCWPSHPNWEQLEDGAQLRDADVVFEFGQAEPGATTRTLRLGEDFDRVVLAISAAALPPICGEVMAASEPFREMLDHTATTMTQSFQVWLTTPPDELGFPHDHTSTSTFIEPLDTGCDNSQLLWSEQWPADRMPRSVWYFCGTMVDEPGDDLESLDVRARTGALEFLEQIGVEWPGAIDEDGSFRWELLATLHDLEGSHRFDAQFWRANATPTERYVQTLPGTVRYRLGADESGLPNLVLAGDWTRNGMDIGAVEATVMSGMLASRAICGSPTKIAWERQAWMVDGPPR